MRTSISCFMRYRFVATSFNHILGKYQYPVFAECKTKSKKYGWLILVKFPKGNGCWMYIEDFETMVVEKVNLRSIRTIRSYF